MNSRSMMGVRALGAVRPPAPMGQRFLAHLIDSLVIAVPVGALLTPALVRAAELSATSLPLTATIPKWSLILFGLGVILALILGLFQWWFQGSRGFTIGKLICKIRTVDITSGNPAGMGRVFLRQIILGVGSLLVLVSPFFDGQKRNRGWHDRAVRTLVIDQNAEVAQHRARAFQGTTQRGDVHPEHSPFAPVSPGASGAPMAPSAPQTQERPAPTSPFSPVPTPPPPPPRSVPRSAPTAIAQPAAADTPRPEPQIISGPGGLPPQPIASDQNLSGVPAGSAGPYRETASTTHSLPAYLTRQAPPADMGEADRGGRPPVPPPPAPIPVPTEAPVPMPTPPPEPSPAPPTNPGFTASPASPANPPMPPNVEGVQWPRDPSDQPTANSPSVHLRFSDGREFMLTRNTLIGRNPDAGASEAPSDLIRVSDPGRSVSKTHLMIGFDDEGLWIVDRASTNGTIVTLADQQQIICAAHQVVRLPDGATVTFGDYSLNFEFHNN